MVDGIRSTFYRSIFILLNLTWIESVSTAHRHSHWKILHGAAWCTHVHVCLDSYYKCATASFLAHTLHILTDCSMWFYRCPTTQCEYHWVFCGETDVHTPGSATWKCPILLSSSMQGQDWNMCEGNLSCTDDTVIDIKCLLLDTSGWWCSCIRCCSRDHSRKHSQRQCGSQLYTKQAVSQWNRTLHSSNKYYTYYPPQKRNCLLRHLHTSAIIRRQQHIHANNWWVIC